MRTISLATAALLIGMAVQAVQAADVVGFNKVTVPANSDAVVTVPFVQKSVGSFAATGTTGTGIVIAGGLAANAFQNVFYVRMTSGPAAGRWSTVTGNSATEFTLADTSFLASVAAGNTFDLVPHQTLARVFSDDLKDITFTASTSPVIHTMEVLLPDGTSVGINKAPNETYYYRAVSGVSAWRKVGAGASISFDNTILPPGAYFVLRNNNATALSFLTKGNVAASQQQARTVATESAQNDLPAASGNPFPVTLLDLNLGGTPAFQNSTSPVIHTDELLVFSNTTGQNNPPPITYYYRTVSGVAAWRKVGAGASEDHNSDIIPAGAALVIRKGAGTPGSAGWVQPAAGY